MSHPSVVVPREHSKPWPAVGRSAPAMIRRQGAELAAALVAVAGACHDLGQAANATHRRAEPLDRLDVDELAGLDELAGRCRQDALALERIYIQAPPWLL
jgi:hypothetical protein